MMTSSHIPFKFLASAGHAVLMASAAFSLVRAIRNKGKLEGTFLGIVAGILGLTFYSSAFETIHDLGLLLEKEIQKLGNPQVLKTMVWDSIQSAASEPGPQGEKYLVNLPAVVEQLFRTGVWGIVTNVGDFFFLLAEYFLEVKRDVLLTLVQFLFPLIWGLYPALPSLGNSIIAYVIEMSLWGPCLFLIQIVVGYVAPKYLKRPGSLGVPMVAVEIVATLLILEVPSVVHRLLNGTLHPGGENAALGMIFVGTRAVQSAQKTLLAASKRGYQKKNPSSQPRSKK